MRRPLLLLALAALMLLAAACADLNPPTAPAGPAVASLASKGPAITVMTRNMYLGADIDALIAPGADPSVVIPEALTQISRNDFVGRAKYIALEIAQRQPEAVGLQEVTHYIFNLPSGYAELDFLDVLQLYLAAMGAQYDIAVRQANVSLTIPLDPQAHFWVNYTDGDAILVRHDVAWTDPAQGHYPTQQELTVAGFTFDNLRGWNAVTIHVNDADYRFVNTHMEIQAFRSVQEQQARELAALLAGEALPIILVGDFNSAANPSAPAQAVTDTYHILRNAGFADLELREPHSNTMLTCCHAADLSVAGPPFDQRLDLVLARFGTTGFGGQSAMSVVATPQSPVDPDGVPASGDEYSLFPSDHAAVFGQLWPAPGLLK